MAVPFNDLILTPNHSLKCFMLLSIGISIYGWLKDVPDIVTFGILDQGIKFYVVKFFVMSQITLVGANMCSNNG